MRLIDADALAERITKLKSEICSRSAGWVDEDSYECGAVDGLLDALNYIADAQEIPYGMKWNPDCEDCLPEGIDDCIECHKRQEAVEFAREFMSDAVHETAKQFRRQRGR